MAVGLLLSLGLFATFGIAQLNMVQPPWTLLLGMTVASVGFSHMVDSLSEGASQGYDTILWAQGTIIALALLRAAMRYGFRYYRLSRIGNNDPFTPEHLPDTLVLVDELSRLGHRLIGSRQREQTALIEAMRQAGETLRERLDKGA